jgi:hypothetical protein
MPQAKHNNAQTQNEKKEKNTPQTDKIEQPIGKRETVINAQTRQNKL